MPDGFHDPGKRRRTITALLVAAVPLFLFGHVLAVWYGQSRFALLMGLLAGGMALGAAGVIALFGPNAPTAFAIIAAAVTILSALFGR